MGGEHRLDVQARQQGGHVGGADALARQADGDVAQAAGLRCRLAALVLAPAADAVHALGHVDRLEVAGEGAHQGGGVGGVQAAQQGGEFVHRRAVVAARDGGAAHALHLGEEVRALLFGQDLAHQGADAADVLAQRAVGGGEVGFARGVGVDVGAHGRRE